MPRATSFPARINLGREKVIPVPMYAGLRWHGFAANRLRCMWSLCAYLDIPSFGMVARGMRSRTLRGNWRAEMALRGMNAGKQSGTPRMTILRLASRAVQSAGMKLGKAAI